ncbi:MAG: HAMP domain-containing histidine kinase, partial [Candidatus Lokiarchaeota archaeon]|nr:HAMP domain-containing histidine kinase [Candidatus Lokiarchaeota archaeon]
AKFPSENPFPVLRATKEKILYSNKAGEDLFKIKERSRPPHELLGWIYKAINLDIPQFLEVDFADKTFSFNILSIKDEGYVNIYGRDITERRCAEIELQKSEATYREAYKRAEFYKDIFTHDINNILQNISNGIQLNEMYLNKPDKSNAIKRNIDIIKRQVKRGANLVSNVRKLSKISESEAFLFKVNCIEVLKKSINYIKNSFHDKNLKIDIQISDNIFKILANELLEDVFDNILTNSINYNDNEFINIEIRVTKELRQGLKYIKLQFSDNGIGITDERKDQIFIRGYSEKTSIHGMGLGLSLVKKILESYDSEIWMEDRVKGDYTKGNNCIILIPEVVNND